jgi:hypothetical protein
MEFVLMDIRFMLHIYNPEMKHYYQSRMGASKRDHLHNEIISEHLKDSTTINDIAKHKFQQRNHLKRMEIHEFSTCYYFTGLNDLSFAKEREHLEYQKNSHMLILTTNTE